MNFGGASADKKSEVRRQKQEARKRIVKNFNEVFGNIAKLLLKKVIPPHPLSFSPLGRGDI